MNRVKAHRKTLHLLIALSLALSLLIMAVPAAVVEADSSEEYTASEIEDWLIDQVESTTVPYTTPTVDLGTAHQMEITVSMTILGTTVELNPIIFTFDGSNVVKIKGQLSLLTKNPRFGQDDNDIICIVACSAGGTPQLTSISNINIGGYTPSLSEGALDKIVETINKAIDASGFAVASLGGELTGIDVSGGELELSWAEGSITWDAATTRDKLEDAMDSLVDQANDYLGNGYGDPDGRWWLRVSIASSELTFAAQFKLLGITAKIEDMDISFTDLTASFTDARVSVGTSTKEATFSGTADIACSSYVPSLTVTDLSAGNEYPGLQGKIEEYEPALRDALKTLVDNIVGPTGLTCRLATFDYITVTGEHTLEITLTGIPIVGVTREVNCEILPGDS